MDKTAAVRVLIMAAQGLNNGMSKEAGWWDNLKQWAKDKIEDPTGARTEIRKNREQALKQMQDNASNYVKPEFRGIGLFSTPFTEEKHKRVTQNYNDKMKDLYRDATVVRGNKPYMKDTSGNYAPAPGAEYK